MKRAKKIILITIGTVSVALGILGVFLPLLPTTPFLLLSAACYSRSSERFYNWLVTNKWFGPYISNYREGRGIALGHKIYAISVLWLTIGATAVFAVDLVWVRILLVGIASAVTWHIASFKTYREEPEADEVQGPDAAPQVKGKTK